MDGRVIVLRMVTTFTSKWVPMNFDGTKKKLLKGSQSRWEPKNCLPQGLKS